MRLIACHIENFGTLSNTDFKFEDGLNVTLKENGWGKSTFTYFIKAMFYGLEGDGKRDDIQSERKRFAPWQGGAFGGSLTFETKGKHYVISRVFGAKAAEDVFELRDADTNLVSLDYSEKVGEELFHINSESFIKTVFIKQSDCSNVSATDDINAKLGNISDGIDLNKFAAADEVLKDALNAFSATRKTGEIARMKAEMSVLRNRVAQGNGIEAAMSEVENRIKAGNEELSGIKSELDDLNEKKKTAAKYERLKADKATHDSLKAEVAKKQEDLLVRKSYFKGSIPSTEICEQWDEACKQMANYKAVYEGTGLSETENTLNLSLSEMFKTSIPSPAEIDGLIVDANNLNRLRNTTRQYALNETDKGKLNNYKEAYGDIKDAEMLVTGAIEMWSERSKNVAEADHISREISDRDYALYESRNQRKSPLLGMIVSLLVILAGAVLALFDKKVAGTSFSFTTVGIIVASFGAIILILCFVKSSGKGKQSDVLLADSRNLKNKLEELTELIDETDEHIEDILKAHGIPFEDKTAGKSLQSLLMEIFEYKSFLSKELDASVNDHSSQCDEISGRISAYLMSYGIYASEEEYPAKLTELKGKVSFFETIRNKTEENRKAKVKLDSIKDELRNQLKEYDIEPGFDTVAKVDEVLDIITEYNSLLLLFNEAKSRLSSFENATDIEGLYSELDTGMTESFEAIGEKEAVLNDRAESIRKALATDNRSLDEYQDKYDEWCEDKEELLSLEALIEEKTRKLSYISKTDEYLIKAKEKLTARYMEPLLTGFKKYYGVLTGEDGLDFHIDANTVITKEEKGRQRSTQALSLGYQDLVGFCMRLAMTDAMYEEEKPVLILDDPFVNLDDSKMDGAVRLLKNVASEYQIMYLTCRENRLG